MTTIESWLVLSLSAVLLLPGIALLAGWVPVRVRHRPGPLRLLGVAALGCFAALQCDTVPRLSQTSPGIISLFAHAGLALAAVGVLLGIAYDLKTGPSPHHTALR
ncbi:hypothetical protein [Streptomyces sp. NPDC001415]